jgi:glycosyltransferase involved in cell wall biosynthesis
LRRLGAPPVLWKHAALPLALLADRVDVFHSPTGTLPVWAPARTVVTVHDLFAELEPRWFPPGMAAHLRSAQRRAASAADAILAVSETTKRDLVAHYGVPPDRVRVVHNGIAITPPAEGQGPDSTGQPYILCVGSLMPWRNAPRLLEAVALLRDLHHAPHRLVFVGRDIWGTDQTARLARERGWTDWVTFAGYVPDEHLPRLYAGADVFAYPSLYEGFGIPPVEAMSCGTPVVASTAGALPEVLGEAALLVDPYDVEALADALWRAISDARLRCTLTARGRECAARYTWASAAEATWRVYEAVLA